MHQEKKKSNITGFIIGFIIVALAIILLMMNFDVSNIGVVIVILVFIIVFILGLIKLGKNANDKTREIVRKDYVFEEEEEKVLFEGTKTCPVCETENIVNRKYCKKCQSNIQNIVCPVCDTKNPHSAKYCVNCDSILQNKTRH